MIKITPFRSERFQKNIKLSHQRRQKEIESDYGAISTSSAGTILRKVIEIEEQGADMFFGEKVLRWKIFAE